MNADAVLPGVGGVWLADFGSDGPWGRFAVELELTSSTRLSLTVAGGDFTGDRLTVDYTTVEVGPGQYIVRWTEPERGTCVTHFQNWNKLEVLASVVTGHGEFVQMLGTLRRSAPGQPAARDSGLVHGHCGRYPW
jgi:hypothetical protein